MSERTAAFEMVELAQLVASPTNPRHTQSKAAMAELVESIRQQGVIVPLLLRPATKDGGKPVMILGPGKVGGNDRLTCFEVVCGSRRFEAAKAAGLTQVPAIIRSLTDTEAMELQICENLQREDVHPMDEAAGYQVLMERCAYDYAGALTQYLKGLKPAPFAWLLVQMALFPVVIASWHPSRLEPEAAAFGVDAKAVIAEVTAAWKAKHAPKQPKAAKPRKAAKGE